MCPIRGIREEWRCINGCFHTRSPACLFHGKITQIVGYTRPRAPGFFWFWLRDRNCMLLAVLKQHESSLLNFTVRGLLQMGLFLPGGTSQLASSPARPLELCPAARIGPHASLAPQRMDLVMARALSHASASTSASHAGQAQGLFTVKARRRTRAPRMQAQPTRLSPIERAAAIAQEDMVRSPGTSECRLCCVWVHVGGGKGHVCTGTGWVDGRQCIRHDTWLVCCWVPPPPLPTTNNKHTHSHTHYTHTQAHLLPPPLAAGPASVGPHLAPSLRGREDEEEEGVAAPGGASGAEAPVRLLPAALQRTVARRKAMGALQSVPSVAPSNEHLASALKRASKVRPRP